MEDTVSRKIGVKFTKCCGRCHQTQALAGCRKVNPLHVIASSPTRKLGSLVWARGSQRLGHSNNVAQGAEMRPADLLLDGGHASLSAGNKSMRPCILSVHPDLRPGRRRQDHRTWLELSRTAGRWRLSAQGAREYCKEEHWHHVFATAIADAPMLVMPTADAKGTSRAAKVSNDPKPVR